MVRKINLSNGSFTFVAGKGKSISPDADYSTPLAYPMGVFFDEAKKNIYLTSSYANRLLLISNWKTFNIAGDGVAGSLDTNLNLPTRIVKWGENIYFADTKNHCIKKISYDSDSDIYSLEVVAGKCGTAGNANGDVSISRLNSPQGLAVLDDDRLLIADTLNHCIRVLSQGQITTYAGKCGTRGSADGVLDAARLDSPEGIVCNIKKKECFVADTGNNLIRKINSDSSVVRYSGSINNINGGFKDGTKDEALFNQPSGISIMINFDESATLYVADRNNHVIREIDTVGNVSTIIGNNTCSSDYGSRDSTGLCFPTDIYVRDDGSLIIVDSGNNRILGVY